jgi:hypothetical protein
VEGEGGEPDSSDDDEGDEGEEESEEEEVVVVPAKGKGKKRSRKEEEEEELSKIMMNKKETRLYGRMQYGIQKKVLPPSPTLPCLSLPALPCCFACPSFALPHCLAPPSSLVRVRQCLSVSFSYIFSRFLST